MKNKITVVGTPQRTQKDGFETVRLRVSFNSLTVFINTGIKWHKDSITPDGISQGKSNPKEFMKAFDSINALKDKISEIFKEDINTKQELINRLENNGNNSDFIQYAKQKLRHRLNALEIVFTTYTAQLESIESLANFRAKIPFDTINPRLLDEFKTYLKREGFARNTIWTRLKDIRTYMNTARKKDKIIFEYPFGENFKMPKSQPRLKHLSEVEFKALLEYKASTLNGYHIEVLNAFLFSCFTGLRISDIENIRGKYIKGKILEFEPLKGSNSETKKFLTLHIPLHEFVFTLLPNKIYKDLPIFKDLPSEQKINKRLKEIAELCKIEPFSFHYSRHTFATRFLRHGGRVEVLQKLLGHESIITTMDYVHIEPYHAREQIDLLTT